MTEFNNHCPARCRATGRCYGRTWFKHLPGPGSKVDCPGDCKYRRDWQEGEDKRKERKL